MDGCSVSLIVAVLGGVNWASAQVERDNEADSEPMSQAALEETDTEEATDPDVDDEVTVEEAQEPDPQEAPW